MKRPRADAVVISLAALLVIGALVAGLVAQQGTQPIAIPPPLQTVTQPAEVPPEPAATSPQAQPETTAPALTASRPAMIAQGRGSTSRVTTAPLVTGTPTNSRPADPSSANPQPVAPTPPGTTSEARSTAPRSGATTTSRPTSDTLIVPTLKEDIRDDGFAWLPLGPADARSADQATRWYADLERGRCPTGTLDGPQVWRALVAVCAAALSGDQARWVEAGDAGVENSGSCLEKAAASLVRRALAWHQRHPNDRPRVRMAVRDGSTACAFGVSRVQLGSRTNCLDPVNGPVRGPTTGWTTLILTLDRLVGQPTVLIAGRAADVICSEGNRIAVLTPPADNAGVAPIRLRTYAGDVSAQATFEYLDAAPPSR
jgi:hypothetical protein